MTKKQLGLMKKIFKYMFAVVAGVAALSACTNEPDDNIKPEEQNGVYKVVASIDEATRATISDEGGMAWQVGDKLGARILTTGGGSHNVESNALTAGDIAVDGKATFTFGHLVNDNPAHFVYNANGGNVWGTEFRFFPAITQENAGEIGRNVDDNKTPALKLASKAVEIATTGENLIETKMGIVGTLLRFVIYSSEVAQGEEVQSVELVSSTDNICGAIAYDYTKGSDETPYYWQKWCDGAPENVDSGENCAIYYFEGKSIAVNLTNPMLVNTTDAASSVGKTVYMPVAPVTANGYKYVVTTDVATYTFDASDKVVKFNDNELKNVLLNLDKATKRVDASATKGTLRYAGVIDELNNYKFSYEGCADFNPGKWWFAETKDTDADGYVKREGGEYTAYYENVVFTYTDATTGDPVDWISVRYNDGGNSAWLFTVQPQEPGAPERRAVVTATFGDVNGYVIEEASRTKSVTVAQMAYSNDKVLSFNPGLGDKVVTSDEQTWAHGYFVIFSNGIQLEAGMENIEEAQVLYDCIDFVCHDMSTGLGAAGPIADWITMSYGKNDEGKYNTAWVNVNVSANTSTTERKVLVCVTMTPPEGYVFEDGTSATKTLREFIITQSGAAVGGGDEPDDEPTVIESVSYTIGNMAENGSKGTGFGPAAGPTNDYYSFSNITINGKAYLPGDDLQKLASNEALMAQLIEKAISFGEVTEEDVQVPGTDPLTTNPESFVSFQVWNDGGAAIYVKMVLTANDSGARRTFKIITKDAEGNQVSSIVYFQNA